MEALPELIEKQVVDWESFQCIYETPEEWMNVMSKVGEYVDDVFIILATKVFSKTIKIIPVIGARTSLIEYLDEPPTIFLLYFEETHFSHSSHYQSVRPIPR